VDLHDPRFENGATLGRVVVATRIIVEERRLPTPAITLYR